MQKTSSNLGLVCPDYLVFFLCTVKRQKNNDVPFIVVFVNPTDIEVIP